MRKDNILSFSIEHCTSELYNISFAIVCPPGIEMNPVHKDQLVNAHINYYLAIKPNVHTIIFTLSSLVGVGIKLYGGNVDCPPIYHLPPRIYTKLEDIVESDLFCVSESYINLVLETKSIKRSIFGLLETTHNEQGLNVLGIIHDATQA